MATLKLVLDKRRKRTDGTYPLVIRLSHQSKTRDIGLGIKLKPKELTSPDFSNDSSIHFINYFKVKLF